MNGIFGVFPRAKNGARAKNERGGSFLPSPLPPPLSPFWFSHHFSRGKNAENPSSLTFFAPHPHGNACYAGTFGFKFCLVNKWVRFLFTREVAHEKTKQPVRECDFKVWCCFFSHFNSCRHFLREILFSNSLKR